MKKLKIVEKKQIKEKITEEFILDQYEKIKKIEDPKEREAKLQTLKTFSQYIGHYLVSEDSEDE